MHPLLNKISDELDLVKDDRDVPVVAYMHATGYTDVLCAVFPGPADRAIFFIDANDDGLLHVAVEADWRHDALDPWAPVPAIGTLPTPSTGRKLRHIQPESWRTVRVSPTQLVTLVDIPIRPHASVRELLDDLSLLVEDRHLLAVGDLVDDFNPEGDPFDPCLSALNFGPDDLRLPLRVAMRLRSETTASFEEVEAR